MGQPDVIGVVEAIYKVDLQDSAWFGEILRGCERTFRASLGAMGFLYDASDPARMRMWSYARTERVPEGFTEQAVAGILARVGATYVEETYRTLPCETASGTPGFAEGPAPAVFASCGFTDLIGVNAVDPTGFGCWLGIPLSRTTKLSAPQRTRFERISAHLASAFRLRRRLAAGSGSRRQPWGAEAILSPRGHMAHASSDDAASARKTLRDAAVALDRARGKLRMIDPDGALFGWKGLVDARWSLVDKFDRDGKHYVLARRNDVEAPGLEALTPRERQVLAHAALGHDNKMIAYELGLAHSTVRVLLARAAAKLGARTREELVKLARSTPSS